MLKVEKSLKSVVITISEMSQLVVELHDEMIKVYDKDYECASPKNMEQLLELPFWRLKPYVRPTQKTTIPKKRKGTSTLEQNKRRKEQKAERVKKYHQKALNQVNFCKLWREIT